jgi:type II secretory pathway component PulM
VAEFWTLGVIERAMKTKRLVIFGVLAVLVVAYIISIIPNFRRQAEWKHTVAALQGLSRDRVETAIQAFTRDRKASGSVVPATVPLRELVAAGYLRTNDIRGLEGRDATVSLSAVETTPQMIWIRVRWTDRSDIALMADGSVQGLRR